MSIGAIRKLYSRLRQIHGRPAGQWSVWCCRPKSRTQREQVIIEAVLTQHTNWRNVELVERRLRARGLMSLKALAEYGRRYPSRLYPQLRPSGFFRAKTKTLLALADFVLGEGGISKIKQKRSAYVRSALLKIHGIGPETADSILLYALDKPIFVVDEYTRRLALTRGRREALDYDSLQALFSRALPKNFRRYQDFHALIVIDGKSQKKLS